MQKSKSSTQLIVFLYVPLFISPPIFSLYPDRSEYALATREERETPGLQYFRAIQFNVTGGFSSLDYYGKKLQAVFACGSSNPDVRKGQRPQAHETARSPSDFFNLFNNIPGSLPAKQWKIINANKKYFYYKTLPVPLYDTDSPRSSCP
ncbi:MAG: hypothetical protein WCA04_01165 [Geobacteraceae bacterium]